MGYRILKCFDGVIGNLEDFDGYTNKDFGNWFFEINLNSELIYKYNC
jgi:hypothetical protein